MPTDSPRRPGGAAWTARTEPSTVRTPKPAPRTAEIQDSQPMLSPSTYSGAGAPRAIRPTASTGPAPNRAVSAGTTDCTATVTMRSTAVTTPAVLTLAPPATAYAGSEARVRQ